MKRNNRNWMHIYGCKFLIFATLSINADAQEFRAHPFLEFGIEGYISAHSEIVDLDGDGDLDIAVANGRHWPQGNMIYLNDGKGRMTESYRLGNVNRASYIVRAGDLDKDGDADLIVIGDKLPIEIYKNNGDGQFSEPEYLSNSESYARGAVLADINNDQLPDLVVVPRRGESKAYLGNGNGGFTGELVLPVPTKGATGIYADDLDLDGDIDLVAGLRDDQPSVVLINTDDGFVMRELPNSVGDHRQVLVGQFTNDDFKDVILGDINGGVRLFKGLEGGFFEEPVYITEKDVSARSLAKGDLNRDGNMDIIIGGDEQSNIALYSNSDDTFESVELTQEANDTYGTAVGDLNGDGFLDLIFSNSESANVVLLNKHKQ